MEKQLIVSISREYGSGGHEIAARLAERIGIKMYDKNLLDELALHLKGSDNGSSASGRYGAGYAGSMFHIRAGDLSTSAADSLAEMQFDYIRETADSGESFVIVGRCSDIILKGRPELITIFISGDIENKIRRVMERRGISRQEAMTEIVKIDKWRRKYHNRHGDTKWGDSRHYGMCINSSIGIEETVDVIESYISKFRH